MNARNRVWYVLLTSSVITNAIIAWGLIDSMNTPNPTATQRFLHQYVSDEFWPILFGLCSFSAGLGMWNAIAVRIHFLLAASLMAVWGCLGVFLGTSPITWAGGFLLLHMAVLKFTLAIYAPKLIRTHKSTGKLLNELDSASNELKECQVSGNTTRYSESP